MISWPNSMNNDKFQCLSAVDGVLQFLLKNTVLVSSFTFEAFHTLDNVTFNVLY